MQISREQQLGPRWWQLKHFFLFSPRTFGEDEPIFDEHMLNKGVGLKPLHMMLGSQKHMFFRF